MNLIFKCETHNHELLNVNFGDGELDNEALKYYIENVKHDSNCNISRKKDGVEIDIAPIIYVSPEKLAELKQEKKDAIKKEAQDRIYDVYLEYQQVNAIATVIELLREGVTEFTGTDPITVLSQGKQDVFNGIYANWQTIKDIRAKSNLIEDTEVDSATNILDLAKVKIKDNTKW